MADTERLDPAQAPIQHVPNDAPLDRQAGDLPPRGKLWDRMTRADSYVLLLVLIMIDYFAISLIGQAHGGAMLQVTTTSVVLLVALRISRVQVRTMRAAAGTAIVAIVFTLVTTLTGRAEDLVVIVVCLLLIVTPFAIGRRILLQQQRVDIETLAGAVDIYVLLGLLFASVYSIIDRFTTTQFFTQATEMTGNTVTYFSFVTLSTLGYGDLTPATNLGRSLVVFEALIGQVFVVTVIARVVSMLGAERVGRLRD